MQIIYAILAALAPVAVLLWYIYRKDSVQPEPTKWLVKAFFYGVISVAIAFPIEELVCYILGVNSVSDSGSVFEAFSNAFVIAAIPEEGAKLIMLWLLVRKNPYFDEHFDGIVYAVCVGLGFAGLENIFYLLGHLADGSWIATGIARALLAVPGHFLDAVFMGYFYSLYHFGIDRSMKGKALIFIAPVLAHGIYDGLLFSLHVSDAVAGISMIVFLIFFNTLRKRGKKRINELVNK